LNTIPSLKERGFARSNQEPEIAHQISGE